MPTSQNRSMLYELETKLPIPLEKRAYFHARVLNNFYQFVFQKFLEEEKSGNLTKAELARRIERKPEVISRLFGAPGNWTLETATDLLLGIKGEELVPNSLPLIGRAPRNYQHWGAITSGPAPQPNLPREAATPTPGSSTNGVFNLPSAFTSAAA